MKKNIHHLAFTLAIITSISAYAMAAETAPDNSGINQRDNSDQARTADSQSHSSRSSTEVTRMIRRELTRDDSLSTYGKNVKIITSSNTVLLRGPVNSEDEKARIENIAEKVASNRVIQNQLEVKQ